MAESAVLEPVDTGANASEWGRMTPEQREAEVDQGVEQAREARIDGAIASGEYRPPVAEKPEPEPAKTTTEQSAGGDETPAAGDAAPAGEGEAEGAGAAEWLDDDTRDFAATMGLTDDELAEFGSREELDRAMRIIDRKAYEAGKAPPPSPTKPIEKQPVQQEKQPVVVEGDPFADLSLYKLGEQFDEDAAKPINRFVDLAATAFRDLQNRLTQFEQRDQQRAADDLRRQAVASLHSLGNTEFFGKPGEKPTKEQVANIEKAIDAHFVHARGLLATGRQAAPTPAFLKAAVHLAFGDQLSKQQQRQLTEKLRKQSYKITGGGSGKALLRSTGDRAKDLAADPELDALFSGLVKEARG
mgnify:FL=1